MATLSQHQQNQIISKILNKPENQYCADCHAKNPTWASIDFGVVICMNCAGAHRTLSRQITRVRSLNLDSWTADILEIVFNIGNKCANDYFEFQIPSNMKKLSNDENLEQRIKYVNVKYIKKTFTPQGYEDPVSEFKKKNNGSNGKLLMNPDENNNNTTIPAKTFSTTQLYQQNSNNTTNNTSKRNSKESIEKDIDLIEINSESANKNKQLLEDDLLDFQEAPVQVKQQQVKQQQQQQQAKVQPQNSQQLQFQLKSPIPQSTSNCKSANGQQDEMNLLDFGGDSQQPINSTNSQNKQINNVMINNPHHHHHHHQSLELQQSKIIQQNQQQKQQFNKIDLFSVYDQKNNQNSNSNNNNTNNIQGQQQQQPSKSNYDVFDQAQNLYQQQMYMQQQQLQRQMQMNNNYNNTGSAFNNKNNQYNQQFSMNNNINGVKFY